MTTEILQLNDLSYLLKKEHIIATITAEQLRKDPSQAEHNYSVHAKTHIPLGETSKYVNNIIKWVGGQNKGSFIGGVTGDYGEGKTSFLIHVWEQMAINGFMVAPPFSWRSISDLIEGINAWVSYKLNKEYPEEAREAHHLWEEHRRHSIEEKAGHVAKRTGKDVDTVLEILKNAKHTYKPGK